MTKRRIARGRRGVWLLVTALVVLGGIVASVLGARTVSRGAAGRQRLAFHLSSAEIASTLRLAIQHEEDLVISASAFISGNPHTSAADFDRWAQAARAMQRYPELQNIGFVALVPAARLAAFEAQMAAHPVRPFGPNSAPLRAEAGVLPAGKRPYYCLAVAGLARNAASYLPVGLDYCTLAPTLMSAREAGQPTYAPFTHMGITALGVETPVYQRGVTPKTPAARRHAFLGWLGELLDPGVVLERALEGHAGVAVRFRYQSGATRVQFASGHVPARAQLATIKLHNGWTVQSFAALAASGVFADREALGLLAGGTLLSLLLGLLVLVLATGRTRALSLVREKTRELSHQALHDKLTGLPNRALVLDRAEQMIARAARQPGSIAGALFVDVDGFKHVNDSLGHAAGDQLLKVVGTRLQETVRDEDTVGRLGGDEFVVLVETTPGEAALDVLADRLIDALRAPAELGSGNRVFSVTASIGVAFGSYESPDELLRDADLALYAAKAAGRDRYALFDTSMDRGTESRLELATQLEAALREEQFFLAYQPIFELSSRRVVGAEALIRWQHPTRGTVAPDSFIPLAEETGLIAGIGRWVLSEACRQASVWAAQGLAIGISVNVSAYQLGRSGFAEDVRRALRQSGIEPSLLTLEITETALMRDVRAACEHLLEIRALGVRVAIDDFGTGYASLSQLQRIPVDFLKVDRSFVAGLSGGGQGRGLLEAILGVGRSLSLTVVAEGIEEHEQLQALEEMGCQLAQGFLLGRPGGADQLGERLSGAQTLPGALGTPAA
ncbi:MAG: putative bifunctional diguanylate cyclase/phosphodiesterase [Solirubrobacteraceae bacterium]